MSIFSGIETLSNHGTSQGILPRFYWQTLELSECVFEKKEAEKRMSEFMTKNIPDFTSFYDLYKEITSDYNDFLNGILNGKYYSKEKNGEFKIDRTIELDLSKKVKDFFILGRLLINNFAKSKLIDNEHFILNELIIVTDKNFIKNKTKYIENDKSKRFEILYNLLEKARETFLTKFNQIRADIEHQNLQIPKFIIDTQNDTVSEPTISGETSMLDEITEFYENLLDLIELLIVYSFGIQASIKNPNLGLFVRHDYNYTQMISKYTISLRIQMGGFTLAY